MRGAKIFVTSIFVILGLSFIASTALFMHEFRDVDAVSLVLTHSHLFLFFPLFGVLALAAFWFPSVIFTDMYWQGYVRYGRLRYSLGLAGVIVIAAATTYSLQSGSPRGVWEIKPEALRADKAEHVTCGKDNLQCTRAPMLETLSRLREESTKRIGLSKFARVCAADTLLEKPVGYDNPRFCFPALAMLPTEACCAVQLRFKKVLDDLYQNPSNHSDAGRLDTLFLFAKTFFIVVILVIGILLVMRRSIIANRYQHHAAAIERGLLVGAAALLIWPMMDYAYHQTALAMFGRMQDGPHLRLSLAIAPWFLLLLFYFLSKLGRKVERWGQALSVGASALALYRYDEANDVAVRFLGTGASLWVIAVMAACVVVGLIILRFPGRELLAKRRQGKLPPQWT